MGLTTLDRSQSTFWHGTWTWCLSDVVPYVLDYKTFVGQSQFLSHCLTPTHENTHPNKTLHTHKMSANSIMDFVGGLTAATSTGKLPSTKQSNELANWLLKSPLFQLEASAAGCGGKLSEHGTTILSDLREIVEAYQAAATEKNGDDIFQDAIFTLGRAGRQQYERQGENTAQSEAQSDAQDLVGAVRVAIEAFLGGVNWGGEAAHFARMTGADVAEAIEKTARDAKDNLREQDQGVSERDQDRDAMDVDNRDARAKYEQNMDTVKNTGSQAIGAGQTVQGRASDVSDRAASRLDEASYRVSYS